MNSFLLTIILLPLALLVLFILILAFVVGLYIMIGVFRSGKNSAIDTTNYVGRLLGFMQLSRHIPRLMKLTAVDSEQGQFLDIAEGDYKLSAILPEGDGPAKTFTLRRPLLRINSQDLMEQLDFRPDDGKVT